MVVNVWQQFVSRLGWMRVRRRRRPGWNASQVEQLEQRVLPTPTVLSINLGTPSTATTAATSVSYRVTFDQAVTGVDPTDFTLVRGSTVGATLTQVTPVSGAAYTVTVSGITGSGTLELDLVDDDSILAVSDATKLGGDGGGNGSVTGQVYTIDPTALNAAPHVVSINRTTPSTAITGASSVSYTVTFNESVTGVDSADFTLALSGVAATTPVVVSGSGAVYTVTVNGVSGNGTLGLNLTDNNSIRDTDGNPLVKLNAAPAFASQVLYTVGSVPRAVVTADVNGDGHPDLIVTNSGGSDVAVLLGNGDGTFQTEKTFATAYASSVAVADVNGDGRPDLLVSNTLFSNGNSVSVLLGNGDGTFQAQTLVSVGTSPYSLAVADMNGDGRPDLIVGNEGSGTVGVLLGNGNGTFQSQSTANAGASVLSVAVGDVNGDGHPDVVVSNGGASNTVSVLLGNGDGTLQTRTTFAAGSSPQSVTMADVNGDGRPDLVIADRQNVSVLLGNGNGTFQTSMTTATQNYQTSIQAADVNGDGRPDLIVTATFSPVSVLLGNGDGSFQAEVNFTVGSRPDSVAVGDLNGDGRPDLIVANQSSGTASVLLGSANGNFTGQVYTIIPHSPTSINRSTPGSAATNVTTVSYTVTFSGPVTGLNSTDFAVIRTGTVGATLTQVTPVSTSVYTVTISGITGSGTLGLNYVDNSVTGLAYTIDPTALNAAPQVVSINRTTPSGSITGASSVSYTVTFSESVTGVDPTDFTLALSGVAATTPVVVSGSGAVYTVTVNGISGNGTLGLNLTDNNSIRDADGNPLVKANAAPAFANQVTYAVGGLPRFVVTADVNADGHSDLIVANSGGHDVGVLLGNGDGTFQAQKTFAAGYPFSVVVADVNGDGRPDLILSDPSVSVLLGNGDGTFQAQTAFSTGSAPYSLAVADMNGDGRPDLIVGNEGSSTVGVLLGNGNGTFQSQSTANAGASIFSVAVGDVNGDGHPDVVVSNGGASNTVSVLLGNGDGTLQTRTTFAAGSSPQSVTMADVNGDGRPDLVIADGHNVSVLLGNGDGKFQTATTTAAQNYQTSIQAADVNGDGRPDLIVTARFSPVSVLLGNGDGTFQGVVTFAVGTTPQSVAVGDLNGDGRPDLLVANLSSGTVSVLLASGNGNFTGQVYTIIPHSPTSINRGTPGSAATNATTVSYAVTFSGPVTGLDPTDFALVRGNGSTVGATLVQVTPVSTSVYTVTISGITGSGTLGLNYVDNSVTGLAYTIDPTALNAAPQVVSINRTTPSGSTTSARSVSYTVTFSESVTGVDSADFTLALSGVAATTPVVVSGSGAVYTVTVNGISGNGTLGLNLADNNSIRDADGNPLVKANAAPAFANQVTYAVGGLPRFVVTADVNADGHSDLIVANSGGHDVGVLLGNGDGTFQAQKTFAAGYPFSVVVADVNGDGRPDLILSDPSVSVLLGNGDGTFQAQTAFSTGSAPYSLAVADMNGDGRPDLIVGNEGSSTVGVLLGNGNGTFQAQSTANAGASVLSVAVGDVNGDGHPDVVVSNGGASNTVSVLLGNGDGTLQTRTTFAAGSSPQSVTMADVNGDGRPDLVIADGHNVSVLLGNGDGKFQTATTTAAQNYQTSIQAADVNGDGRPDLIVTARFSPVSVLLGNGDGTFQGVVTFAVGTTPQSVAVGDLNGDGRPDLLVANLSSGTVSVLLASGNGNFTGQVYTIVFVNNAPAGTDKTVTTLEDTPYTFVTTDFGFTDPNDSPANTLLAVKITTLPGAGTLKDNGVAVTGGQFVTAADISGGLLVFTPAVNANGTGYTSFTFQVQDNGGTANSGVDLDQSPNTLTFNVTSVNDAPAGTNNTVTTLEDTAYTFATTDFGFTDPSDNPANALLAVEITTLPGAGTLKDNGVAVTATQLVSAADIGLGRLVFTPATNANGSGYASFTFQVQDDGGTANGGIDLDQTPNTLTVDVTTVNNAPAGSDNTVTTREDTPYTFATTDFGFTDPNDSPANTLLKVEITTLPGAGTLKDNGVAVSGGQLVTAADIGLGRLVFTPATNANGTGYANFTFQVQDDGGTANSGVDLDQSPNTFSVDVTSVNDAPAGTNNTVTTLEDTSYTFATADFGFSDPNDNPANTLLAVKITTLPGAGTLKDNGVAVSSGQLVTAADIGGGLLVFTPATNANGAAYASFTFQVQDNGGTANSGVDLDQTPNTLTFNVTSVNDAPAGTDTTVTTLEDTAHTFATADFGFTDPKDNPANALLAVEITTLPGAGTLKDNGVAVTATQLVSAADIGLGRLVFTPATNANGSGYASFTFQVRDDGGTANGGIDLDQTPNTLTVDVTTVNNAPAGADNTVTTREDTPYTFATTDFGFTDPNDSPANALLAVKISTLPVAGTLKGNGVAVTGGQLVSAADIGLGRLVFTPAANGNGAAYASFTFQVQDDGGTANSGVDLDQSPNTFSVDVTSVNDAPAGADKTVTTLEDSPYTFATADFGFTDPSDNPANALLAVKITTLPGAGTLKDNGVAVTGGQLVSAADINGGLLVFTPATNANGAAYASFTFQVQDDGGTANSGVDLDQSPNTFSVDVTSVNDAPAGADKTVTTLEDTPYTFAAADFGFTDPSDNPANALLAVEITTLPGAGTLKDNGVAVTATQLVTVADINGGLLVFTPAANANGAAYASFTFQVQDDGGTANSGVDLDQTPNTLTVDVTTVNNAPAGSDNTVATREDTPYTFAAADFGFTDPSDSPANALLAVEITTLPGAGTLKDNGVAVSGGQFVTAADIGLGRLVFTPAANANGTGYASFTFQVRDDGGTANGGVDLDQTPNTLTLNVTSVNDAPAGTDKTVTTLEDTPYTFATADFGFTDPNDNPANTLLAVKITTLPGAGTLKDNGVAVTGGQLVSAADIGLGRLVYTPAANGNGAANASFTFQVQDNGGTANGGVDLDPSPNTLTFNVTSVNDAPAGTNNTVTTLEDTPYTFAAADFGFTDPSDNPANALLAVEITTLPGAGTLKDNGVAVTATQLVSAADIGLGRLVFTPATNANGSGYASFTFQVQDDGGTANGGIDLDQTPNTLTVDVTTVNNAPAGSDNTVTTREDTPYTFATTDFGFTDPNDSPANTLLKVEITTLPGAGTLKDNGVAVSGGQLVTAADIGLGRLVFTPATNANGTGYANFTFQVQDDGGTANSGVDLDQSPNTFSVDVTSVNDAPAGTNNTVTTLEDTSYTFATADFGFSDPNDNPANTLLAVKITTLPGAGTLKDNGVAVSSGQLVTAADIGGGLLVFTPATNANGAAYASFTFQVQDNGGTANSGVDLDQTPNTLTFNVTSVNDAPAGTDTTVTTLEDTAYTFVTADFGFTDPKDNPANALLAVEITTLPGAGTLKDNGSAVTATQLVTVADINGGLLVFTPATNANGSGYASFTFQVRDDGGTANSGVDLDQTPNTLTVDVTTVNNAPAGSDNTVTTREDTPYTFATTDFGFTDPSDNPANALLAVEITTLPGAGTLKDNGVAVSGGQLVTAADIGLGRLVFTPAANGNGAAYASFTFQVQDGGGTANSGVDLDQSPNTLTVDVTSVNDAPAGTNNTVTTLEDTSYTFATADFGFSDPNDNPANTLLAVKITTLPGAGMLKDNGVAVTGGQLVSAADIGGGLLVFTPAANGNGTGYASFTFQVQDDGGTANSGVDLDQTPNTLTFNVTSVNDAPAGTNNTVTTLEDTPYTFAAADFGFTDPSDNPANALLAVEITTLPGAGTLKDNGVAVTATQLVTVADINGGLLVFTPATNANGAAYASFTFQVQDDGGTANGGIDLDQTPNTLIVDVTTVNNAPAGSDKTVTTREDTPYTFATTDFGFTDPNDSPANALLAVEVTTLPGAGTLKDNGVAVSGGQFVTAADIGLGRLVFTPAANANGTGYASFTFQVQDDGGTANSGVDLDQSPNTLTLNVTSVNDAPAGTNNTVTTLEDTSYTFATADFGFSDPNDSPANALLAVKITTLPGAGTLKDNGVAVTATQVVSAADIGGGLLVFTPATNANGAAYASFTFQVQDNGGTANSGVDLDQTPNTLTFNVTSVNDAPAGTDKTVSTFENNFYTFATADFGFTDPNDNPANTLLAVEITTLPGAGTLKDNTIAVTGGQFVTAADISGGLLVFTPATNANGTGYTSFTFQVQDNGGTANSGVDLDQSPNTLTVDVTPPPLVTDAKISISGATGTGGAYKVGDTVTATWNNTVSTGDANTDIAGVTVDFSQFGGGTAVAASDPAHSGIWTASYVIAAGSIDATNRNVSVTATDDGGNATTAADTTNAPVDDQVPVVTDAKITISGHTGTNNTYRVGDTVTATWDDTVATGDANLDIVGVTVDFSAFGGGTVGANDDAIPGVWTATYLIVPGNIDGMGRNVSVAVTDDAGNTTIASPPFQGQATFDTGKGPLAVSVADLNGDGKPDLVTVNYSSNSVSVLLGNGDGTFQSQTTFGTGTFPRSVAVGDMNGDGRTDLIVSNFGGNSVSVLLGNGDGTFQAQVAFAAGTGPMFVTAADVNADGWTDLLVANGTSGSVSVLLGNGDGTFQTQATYSTGAFPRSVAAVDLNGDGRTDLLVANFNNNDVSVLLGNGDGTFQTQTTYAAGHGPILATAADVNGDGRTDLVVANDVSSDVSVLLGNGDGTFQAQTTFAAGNLPLSVAVGDVNGDGRPDLVVSNYSDNNVGELLGNGDGTFQGQVTFPADSGPAFVVVRDVNGDGRPDLVAATYRSNTVSVLQASAGTRTGDTTNATVDNQPPVVTGAKISISGASGTGGAYKVGDTVTATWNNTAANGNANRDIAGVTVDFSTFGGGSVVAATNSSGTWTATYLIAAGAIDGTGLNVSVTATDDAGNTTTTADSTGATVDDQLPVVTAAHISVSGHTGANNTYKVGDTVSATWDSTAETGTANADIAGMTVDFSLFGGGTAVAASDPHNTGIWTATYVVVAGVIDATGLNVSLTATDDAGNTKAANSSSSATVDDLVPVVTGANIAISGNTGANGEYKAGDTVTATWDNSGSGDGANNANPDIAGVTVDFSLFGGGTAVAASDPHNTGIWTATYLITAGSIDATNRKVSVTATDDGGNATTTAGATSATVDDLVPVVTGANIAISGHTGANGEYKAGDTVTATWDNSGSGDGANNANPDIAGVTVDFSLFGGGTAVAASDPHNTGIWMATYLITAGSIDATNRKISVTATDDAGNTKAANSSSSATVDDLVPVVTGANIAISGHTGANGEYKAGDTVTATWDNSGSGDGANNANPDIAGVTVDFSLFGGGTAVAASDPHNTGIWMATYLITAGNIDATNRKISVTATDDAGNTKAANSSSSATVDDLVPVVTGANIAISGHTGANGEYKAGDTVTATWDNSGSGDGANNANPDIAGVTVDFSLFGGGTAVAASDPHNTGIWMATYLITAGNIDAANRNVSVTATDDGGNATTTADTTNATVDDLVPVVTAGHINLSGHTGTNGAYKVGDTVTATWDNTGSGDNNTDLAAVNPVTIDFSQFGGGVMTANDTAVADKWTATYTIVAGNIDGTGHVSVTATDDAANATTGDSANATVDDQPPVVTAGHISVSGHTGANNTYKVGDTVTVTWDSTAETGTANLDIAGVTVDFSAFGAATPVTAATSLGIWTATYVIVEGGIDGNSLNVSVTAADDAGNTAIRLEPLASRLLLPVTGVIVGTETSTSTYGTAASNVTYDIEVNGFNGSTFNLSSVTNLPSGVSASYDNSLQTITVNRSRHLTLTLSTTAAAQAVSSQAFTVTVTDAISLNEYTNQGSFTINQAALTVTADTKSKVYGAADPALTYSVTGLVNGDSSSVVSGVSMSTTTESAATVGTHAITASGGTAANYAITDATGMLTVTKATLTLTADNKSKVFGAADPTLTYSVSGLKYTDTVSVVSGVLLSTTTGSAATYGTHTITASGGTAANYNINDVSGTLTVSKAALTLTADNQSKVYGDADPTLTFTPTGFQYGDDTSVIIGTVSLSTTTGSAATVGTHTITASGGTATNYTVTDANGTLTVTAAGLTVTADNKSKVYGAADPTLTYKVSGLKYGDDTSVIIGVISLSTTTGSAATVGTHAITVSGGTATNYAVTDANGTLTATPAGLTVTADNTSKVYGAADPSLTYKVSGLKYGDASSVLTGVTLATTTGSAATAGTHAITASGGTASNYTVTLDNNGVLTVGKAVLTIKADNKTKVYGATDPALTYSAISGLQYTDDVSVVSTSSLSTTTLSNATVGMHQIVASDAVADNYTVTARNGTLTVTRAALTVTADSFSKTYGDSDPSLTYTLDGLQYADDASVVTGVKLTTKTGSAAKAGVWAITASGGMAANYSITDANGTLTVAKAALTIQADDKSKVYGASDPTLTFSVVSGLLYNDSKSVVIGAVLTTTTGSAATATPGITFHAITFSTAGSASNYTLVENNGKLTVSQAVLTIKADNKTKIYGATDPVLTYSLVGLKYSDTDSSVLGSSVTLATATGAAAAAGKHDITFSTGGTATNYAITDVTGTLTVSKTALTIRADDQTKVYGASDPTLTFHIFSGLITGGGYTDTIDNIFNNAPTLSTKTGAQAKVGTFTITASGGTADNYIVTDTNGMLMVTKAVLTLTPDDQTKVYGAADPKLTFTIQPGSAGVDGLQYSDTKSVVSGFTLTTTTGSAATVNGGTAHDITGSGGTAANYSVVFSGLGHLTVTPAALTVKADNKSKVYGAADPTFTETVTGLKYGDASTVLTEVSVTPAQAAGANQHAGTYGITASSGTAANYTVGTYIDGTLTVSKALLTVTALGQTEVYGTDTVDLIAHAAPTANPTVSFTGLVNGDLAANLVGGLALSTTVGSSATAGTHAIKLTGATDDDYKFTDVNGTLTVTPAALTIQADTKSKVYGASDPTLTFSVVNPAQLAYGDAQSVVKGAVLTTTKGSAATAGTHDIAFSSPGTASNYTITALTAVGGLTVSQAELTVTANNMSKVYGAVDPTFTDSIIGLKYGDLSTVLTGVALTPAVAAGASQHSGTYTITASAGTAANYHINYVTGTLTVAKARLTVTADDKTKTFGGSDPGLTYSINGLQYSDTGLSLFGTNGIVLSTTTGSTATIGTHSIVVTAGVSLQDYVLTLVNGKLTVHI